MGPGKRRHHHKPVFRPIAAAQRARYRRLFRRFLSRYHHHHRHGTVAVEKQFGSLFCRLMHRQYLAQELKARPRQHRLVLDKHVGTPPGKGGCGVTGPTGTIPSYFRKRVLRHRLDEKRKEEEEVEEEEVLVDEGCESDSSDEAVLLDEEDRDVVVEKKHPEIPDPTKFSILKDEIKEYCAIQEKVQIVLSMLKSRAKELEKDGESEDEKKVEVKEEPVDELKTLAEQYYDDDSDDEVLEVTQVKTESDGEVEEVESKPEIVFVDADALDNDSQLDSKPLVVNCKEESLPEKSLKEISKEDLLDPTLSHIKLEPIDKKNSVVDALFNRFNLTLPVTPPKSSKPADENDEKVKSRLRDRRKIPAPRYVEEDEEPKKVRGSRIFDKIHKKLNIDLENTNSNSSTEFYGFDDGEAIKLDKPSVPGLLPTPIVKRSRPNAPFLAHGTSFEDIKIENRDDLFREEGLISIGSLPPRLECPRRPDDMVRPRTVAQKRILLQKKNDVRYLMIDNESKIFYELEKRGKNIEADLDFDRMQELQDQNIPFTRDTWRALAWMRTVKGRYFFQTLKIDNHSIKLTGCMGNHPSKKLGRKQLSAPANVGRKHVCRCPEFPPGINIDLSAIEPQVPAEDKSPEPEEPSPQVVEKKLFSSNPNRLVTSRPGPLSSKFRYDNQLLSQTEDGAYLGPLEILEMPSVEIEVFPRIDRPLDPTIKPYLKMILPFKGITEKWARFAVSTLKTPDLAESDIPKEDRSFSFSLPYANNQRRILIRRRVVEAAGTKQPAGSLEKFERQLNEPLTFRKHLDEPEDPEKVDPVEKECADVLSDMTNAVAIGLAEGAFIQKDPDCDYTRADKPVNKTVPTNPQDGTKSNESAAKSKRMLREMRRLNATIIESIPEPEPPAGEQQGRKRRCDERYCARGCICDVFSNRKPNRGAPHCTSIECVFGCQCGFDRKQQLRGATANKDMVQTDVRGAAALSNEDVKYLREKATARLAKEEREFTPTVILTTNSTVLVRNTETETRRHKKKPKKYDDYYNDNSVKNLLNGQIPVDEDQLDLSVENGRVGTIVDKPTSLKEKIRHSRVVLNKLQDLDSIEPWCMIHCLYRCYCRGKATSGKPFKFNEESDIVLPTPMPAAEPDPLLQVYEPRRRRLYSFEKTEQKEEEIEPGQQVQVPPRKRDSSEESYKPWNERRKKRRRTLEDQQQQVVKKESSESVPSSTRASIEDLQISDGQTCRRVIPVNRNFYKTRNFYRRERIVREDQERKRKFPMAERRLKALLDRCERRFFEDRRRELEQQAKRALEKKAPHSPEAPEPIHIDISDSHETLKSNPLLRPLMDLNKVLIYCGAKKYYVEREAITNRRINLTNIAKKFRTTVLVIRRVPENAQAKFITFKLNDAIVTVRGRKYRRTAPLVPKEATVEEQEPSTSVVQDSPEKEAMLEKVNSDIAHTMRHIREMLRKTTTVLNKPKKGILYLFRWEKFLQAYNEDTLDVWDITFQSGASLVIITTEDTRKNVPSIKDTKVVRSVRKCNFETKGISLLTQMLVYQIDNRETSKLALVLFGTENYWRFCGFIKTENNFLDNGFEARPTPVSHPKLAPKINRYFEAFALANQKRKEQEVPQPEPVEEPPQEEPPTSEPPKFKTNVKLMETKIKDFKNIAIPNVPGTRRWFMLTIVNDFSDIYIPSWKSCLTYGRIMQAIQLANRYRKTVKLTSIVLKNTQDDVLPQIYAAPGQGDCIFLGPYSYTQNIDLMLCQNVDGKMYTREEYERNNHIVRTEQTTGSWLYMKPSQGTATGTSETATTEALQPAFVRLTPGTRVATVTATTTTTDNDCVVIDDDDDVVPPPEPPEQQPDSPKEPEPLESLIHQLYDDSDDGADDCSALSEAVASKPAPPEPSKKNELSALVDKTIAESKQLQIQAAPLERLTAPKRKSTGTASVPDADAQKPKVSRLSLPAPVTTTSADEVVCLDDDEDAPASAAPKTKAPSSTTILNSQQAALIASKINLMNPTQKGVVYNPSTGVLRIKRSLMNSLTEGSSVSIPTVASSSKSSPQKQKQSMISPPAAPIEPPATTQPGQSPIVAPKSPTPGVLRSNIPGMGLVPVVWSSRDIILKVRELSVKLQYVRLSNFEAGIMLLNRFIRKNTYTFKPFALTIGWKFEARTTSLPPEENLINTISLRCVVTPDGVIDLYKASAIVAFQNTKPNFYEELLLLRLSILCCKKEQYEQEKCHKYFENIFVKAANTIKELNAASEALTTQSTFLREQQDQRRAHLAKLGGSRPTPQQRSVLTMVSKRVSVPQAILERVANRSAEAAPIVAADPSATPKEAVIIIDDD